jgi:hypothetical protein
VLGIAAFVGEVEVVLMKDVGQCTVWFESTRPDGLAPVQIMYKQAMVTRSNRAIVETEFWKCAFSRELL